MSISKSLPFRSYEFLDPPSFHTFHKEVVYRSHLDVGQLCNMCAKDRPFAVGNEHSTSGYMEDFARAGS